MATTLMSDTETHAQNMKHALWRVQVVQGLLASHRVLRTEGAAWLREENDLVTRLLIAQQKVALLKAAYGAG